MPNTTGAGYVPCNEDPCPIDCGYSTWVPWATCDHSCGPGTTISRATPRLTTVQVKAGEKRIREGRRAIHILQW